MFFENIKEAITSIFSNKMRSLLTMLGIIIGISSVIIITTIGGSIQSTLTATLNSMGGNTVSTYVEARYHGERRGLGDMGLSDTGGGRLCHPGDDRRSD